MIKSRRNKWAGHVARTWERRSVYRVLMGKPEGKRSLRRQRHSCKDNFKMDLLEVVGGRGHGLD
jgi:hypothetical protein